MLKTMFPGFIHEIAHHWAGHWDILNNDSGHWEFSSGGGQLGGWSYGSLENLEMARNPSWEDKDQGLFSADSIDRYSIEDIVQL